VNALGVMYVTRAMLPALAEKAKRVRKSPIHKANFSYN
jgi:hypothetical protein